MALSKIDHKDLESVVRSTGCNIKGTFTDEICKAFATHIQEVIRKCREAYAKEAQKTYAAQYKIANDNYKQLHTAYESLRRDLKGEYNKNADTSARLNKAEGKFKDAMAAQESSFAGERDQMKREKEELEKRFLREKERHQSAMDENIQNQKSEKESRERLNNQVRELHAECQEARAKFKLLSSDVKSSMNFTKTDIRRFGEEITKEARETMQLHMEQMESVRQSARSSATQSGGSSGRASPDRSQRDDRWRAMKEKWRTQKKEAQTLKKENNKLRRQLRVLEASKGDATPG